MGKDLKQRAGLGGKKFHSNIQCTPNRDQVERKRLIPEGRRGRNNTTQREKKEKRPWEHSPISFPGKGKKGNGKNRGKGGYACHHIG